MRIDIYLKLTGIFRTRSLAGKACRGGYITIDGAALKSSHSVVRGDIVTVVKPDGSKQSIEVLDIPSGKQVSRKDRQNFFRIVGMEG